MKVFYEILIRPQLPHKEQEAAGGSEGDAEKTRLIQEERGFPAQ